MERVINYKNAVALLKQTDGRLKYVEVPITQPTQLFSDLSEMVKDESKNVIDMQDFAMQSYRIAYKYGYYYCYPYEYDAAYLKWTELPHFYTQEEIDNLPADIEKRLLERSEMDGICLSEDQVKVKVRELLPKNHLNLKQNFNYHYRIYLECESLHKVITTLKEKEEYVMYSTDEIGWSNFEYPISEDVKVIVSTNFGYGSSSYFLLKVQYKDVVIVPYSCHIYYPHACMDHFLRFTRQYEECSLSWKYALEYVENFVNSSIENPKEFIKRYILDELDGMLKNLEDLSNKPRFIYEKYRSQSILQEEKYKLVKFSGSEFLGNDRYFQLLPHETILVHQIEYITDSLHFVTSLQKLKELSDRVDYYIERILYYNKQILPSIEKGMNDIKIDIEQNKLQNESLRKELVKCEKEIAPYREEINFIRRRFEDYKIGEEVVQEYKKENPRYGTLIEEIDRLNAERTELQSIISSRQELIIRLKRCHNFANKRIADYTQCTA